MLTLAIGDKLNMHTKTYHHLSEFSKDFFHMTFLAKKMRLRGMILLSISSPGNAILWDATVRDLT